MTISGPCSRCGVGCPVFERMSCLQTSGVSVSRLRIRAARVSSAKSALWAIVCVFLGLGFVPSAMTFQITKDKESPVDGEPITFTASSFGDCGYEELRFEVDGVP